MKALKKTKSKINTLLIDRIQAYANDIKGSKKHCSLYSREGNAKNKVRADTLKIVIGDLLRMRAEINSMLDSVIYEGIIK